MIKDEHTFRVASFADLHSALSRYRQSRWLFRGHSDPDWQLIPKIGRPPYLGVDEDRIFRAWKRRAVEFMDFGVADDWDMLAVAQHHGLATRLLDWTYNPLAAAFFSCFDSKACDAYIYAFYARHLILRDRVRPLDYEGTTVFRPSAVAARISRQSGIFTVHGPPDQPLDRMIREGERLELIIVDKTYRNQLCFDLDHYGVNRLSLFPDLDGLSAYVNWFLENRSNWKDPDLLADLPFG